MINFFLRKSAIINYWTRFTWQISFDVTTTYTKSIFEFHLSEKYDILLLNSNFSTWGLLFLNLIHTNHSLNVRLSFYIKNIPNQKIRHLNAMIGTMRWCWTWTGQTKRTSRFESFRYNIIKGLKTLPTLRTRTLKNLNCKQNAYVFVTCELQEVKRQGALKW